MRWKNILGVVGALFFAAQAVLAVSDGSWRQGFAIVSLWIACAYWRSGEGLDDSYNKQQNFIAGGFFGLMGLITLRLDVSLPDADASALVLYLSAAALLLLRLLDYVRKNAALVMSDPSAKGILRFIFFQPPEQMRPHTRE